MYNPNIVLDMMKNFVVVDVDCENPENCKQFIFKVGDGMTKTDDGINLYNAYNELYSNDLYNGIFEEYLTENGVEYAIL
jgi:hypothetical protein